MATPGPWTAVRLVGQDGEPLRGDAASAYVAGCIRSGGDRDFFAVLATDERGDPVDVCHAGNGPTSRDNASLIAAAPDMLAALVALVEMFGPEYEGMVEDCGEVVALTMARRAISDARGGAVEESQP